MGQQRHRGRHLLDVVQDEEQTAVPQCAEERIECPVVLTHLDTQRVSYGGQDEVGIMDRGKRHKTDAVRKGGRPLGSQVERQARLADAARARQGEQADIIALQQRGGGDGLPFPPHQRCRRQRDADRQTVETGR